MGSVLLYILIVGERIMINRILVILVTSVLTIASPAILHSQEIRGHQKSQVPMDACFEIVQSELAAKVTLRINKFTGDVYQIVKAENGGGLSWQKMPRQFHEGDKAQPAKVNYQLFTSGLAVKFTFLMNVQTGATWQLVE